MTDWSNAQAAEMTIAALEGRLAAEHEALVHLVRTMAQSMDMAPDSAAYAKEYRATLALLMEVAVPDDDDEADELAAALRSPIRNPEES